MWLDMKESCCVEIRAPLTLTQQPVFPPPLVWIRVHNGLFLFQTEQVSGFRATPHHYFGCPHGLPDQRPVNIRYWP